MKGAVLAAALITSRVLALRGVSPQDQHKYKPDKDGMWTCLGDPTRRIPIDRINDNYCDCPDGSDEPGTGACAGVKDVKFYCANDGHIPNYIPVRYVDDGKCDYDFCCDGSDEKPGLCPNMCAEVSKEHAKRVAEESAQRARGLEIRAELVERAKTSKSELQTKLQKLNKDLASKHSKIRAAQFELSEAQNEASRRGSSATDAKIVAAKSALETVYLQAKRLRDDLTWTHNKYEQLDSVVAKMREDYNPNFNDPAVKQAIKSWEEITGEDLRIEFVLDSIDESLAQLDEIADVASSGTFLSRFSDRISVIISSIFGIKLAEPGSSPKVDSARAKVDQANRDLEHHETQIVSAQKSLEADFGPDDVLRSLEHECVANSLGEYEYRVCYFGDSSQIGNGHNVRLGSFESFQFSHDKIEFLFDGGTQCWNGPIRTAKITVRCGDKSSIVSVSEPEKCGYVIGMTSPAACTTPEQVHDEL